MLGLRSALRHFTNRLLHPQTFPFSKQLKRKLQAQQKLLHPQKFTEPVPQTDPNAPTLSLPNAQLPNIKSLSMAQKRKLPSLIQAGPGIVLAIDSILNINLDPECARLFYEIFAFEKFTSWLVLTNMVYQTQDWWYKYAVVGAVVAVNFMPTLSIYSIAGQILQIVLVLTNDYKKRHESLVLTQKQRQLLGQRLRIQLYLYTLLISIIYLKSAHFAQDYEISKKLQKIDKENNSQPAPQNQLNQASKNGGGSKQNISKQVINGDTVK